MTIRQTIGKAQAKRDTVYFAKTLLRYDVCEYREAEMRDDLPTTCLSGATVKELMGHADISMTMRYAYPTPETKRGAVEMLLNENESGTRVAHGQFQQEGELA